MKLQNIYPLRKLYISLKQYANKLSINILRKSGGIKISNLGCSKVIRDVIGENNVLTIGENSFIQAITVRIRGNNNTLIIENNVIIGRNCSFWMEGNNCTIHIGAHTTVTRDTQFNCQEDNTEIILGKDCMLSNNIIIRTSDSHPIYDDSKGGIRINPPKSVLIGNHVWIAPNTKIMKGAVIGDGCIIGSDTTISKEIPPKSMAVGRPAKIVKTNLTWTREHLF